MLDRDPAKFGRFQVEEDIKSALLRAHVRNVTFPRPERDPQVLTTVLHALQRGELLAYDGTDMVPRDFWIDKTPQYVRGASGFRFRREDVLALWPDPPGQTLQALSSIRPKPPHKPTATANSSTTPSPAAEPRAHGSPGRKRGSGSIDDTEQLREMLCLLASGRVPSVHAAAKQVTVTKVVGQSRDANIARLREKFRRDPGTNLPKEKTWADIADELKPNWRQPRTQ